MPLPLSQGHADLEGHYWCDQCADRPWPVVEVTILARCQGCALPMGTHPDLDEEVYSREEHEEFAGPVCGYCEVVRAGHEAVCHRCSVELCPPHTRRCQDCVISICPDDSISCRCAPTVFRCTDHGRIHTQNCQVIRRRRANTNFPAFVWENDSVDPGIVVTKHVRPLQVAKRKATIPEPGHFTIGVDVATDDE